MSFDDIGGGRGAARGGYGGGSGYGGSSGGYGGGRQPAAAQSSYGAAGSSSEDEQYLKLSAKVSSKIAGIERGVMQLSKLVAQYGTEKDTPQMRGQVQNLIETITSESKEASHELKALTQFIGQTEREQNERRMQVNKLSNDLKRSLERFHTQQTSAKEKERLYIQTAKRNLAAGDDKVARMESGQAMNPEDEKRQLLESQRRAEQSQLQNQLEFNEGLIQEREEGIVRIERDIVEINTIFRDLAELVTDQGQQLDNIEQNLTSTEDRTGQAAKELMKASDYQKKARRKMCYFLIMIAIAGGVLTVYLLMNSK